MRFRHWLTALAAFSVASPAAAQPLLIADVAIVDAQAATTRPHMDVLVENGRILRVAPTGTIRASRRTKTLSAAGRFLIPGLWDSHVHLYNLTEPAFGLLIANGITSVRDMGGDPVALAKWREAVDGGKLVGPRIKFCGQMLEAPGDISLRVVNHIAVDGPEAAATIVGKLKSQGADCIKMRTYKDDATYAAIAETARREKLPLMGHAPFAMDPLKAAKLGQTTFEHAFYPYPFHSLEPAKKAAIIKAFVDLGVMIDPTLVTWSASKNPPAEMKKVFVAMNPEESARHFVSPVMKSMWRDGLADMERGKRGSPGWIKAIDQAAADVGEMHRAGIPILAGTDIGGPFVYPDTALFQELEILVREAGLSPAEALVAATSAPARLFEMERELGSISAGKLADMIILDANPLENISNIRSVHTVVAQGVVYGPRARRALKSAARRGILREYAESR